MTKSEFYEYIKDRFILLDGATGTNLMKAGMKPGTCPEAWILAHQEVMEGLQRSYVEAGSQILYAPTFTSNRIKLSEYGLYDRMEGMIHELVGISKRASGGKALIAGDLTMTGIALKPTGTMDFEELVDIYKEQIRYLEAAGVDVLIVETMMSLQETRAAVLAAREVSDLAILATLTFESDGRTLYGTDASSAAIGLEALGVAALGANCSTGPLQMLSVIQEMASCVKVPVIAKPNAGLPETDEQGKTVYRMNPETFASEMSSLVQAGARIVGGCCGTDAGHIKALKECLKGKKPSAFQNSDERSEARFLSSERQTFHFVPGDSFFIIGERINPTGKKALKAELREGSFSLAGRYAEEQEAAGAKILDVNAGVDGADEKSLMEGLLMEIQERTNLPLCLDSSSPEVMEMALRLYPGKALVNSVSLEKLKMEKMLPLAAKYGAMFILLPLSDEGLPKSLEERISIIKTVSHKAVSLGIPKKDILVDALVQTVAAAPEAAKDTLATIRWCRENGFSTTCGLSNISFGLPERGMVNAAFLTMAIQNGLTCAIANPSQELLQYAAFSGDLLMGKEGAAGRYIEFAGTHPASFGKTPGLKGVEASKKSEDLKAADPQGDGQTSSVLYQAVLKGRRGEITSLTKSALEAGEDARKILEEQLMPAIGEVGTLFDEGRYFLPQLIASAEAMKESIGCLTPFLREEGSRGQGLPGIVIATVKGDIHDIGKNLVAMMLENYGFTVYDLGKDVSREEIIEAAKTHHAGIIALSALMTTTMTEMENVITYAKEEGIDAAFMIGGAVVTPDYAEKIGASYSEDAQQAVQLALKLSQKEIAKP